MSLMKNVKKGQISLFVILGIVLVAVVVFAIYAFTGSSPFKQKTDEEILFGAEVEKINSYVKSCVKNLGEEGLIILGKQGGLINLRDNYLETGYVDVRYAYNKAHTFPSLDMISDELSNYISKNLPSFCTFESDTFYEIIKPGRALTEVRFTEDSTRIEVAWPLKIMAENSTQKELKKFKVSLPIRVQKVHEAVESMIEKPENIDLEFTENTVEDMDVKGFLKDEENEVYIVSDSGSNLRGESYKFLFAIKN